MDIALKQSPIQFNDLAQREVLAWGFIEPPNGLYELQRGLKKIAI